MLPFIQVSKFIYLTGLIFLVTACGSSEISNNTNGDTTQDSNVPPDNGSSTENKFSLSSATYSVNEDQIASITITRSNGSGAASVQWRTYSQSATHGNDYLGFDGTLVDFSDGVTSRTLTIDIINDSVSENEEEFQVVLISPSNTYTLGNISSAQVTVFDDDSVSSVPPPANVAPTIDGTALSSVQADSIYSFTPNANDANGDALTFIINNLPAWATFNPSNGTLSGTPTGTDAGLYQGIVISVSDGNSTVALPAFDITVSNTPPPANVAPTIDGTALTSVQADSIYSFTPNANDANGDTLTFIINNLPAWATFNSSNGTISGTPTGTDAGLYQGIVISVSDGNSTVALPAFDITVSQVTYGSATLSWTPPVENADGTALTDLAGYKIYYSTTQNNYQTVIDITNAGLAEYVIDNLPDGNTYYFVITSYTAAGLESAYSNEFSKIM